MALPHYEKCRNGGAFTWYVFLPDGCTPKCASATGQEASIHCTCGKFPGVDSSHPVYGNVMGSNKDLLSAI